MTKLISRRLFLGSLSALSTSALASPLWANAPEQSLRPVARSKDLLREIQKPAEVLVERAKLGGRVGFAVADMSTGKLLEERDATLGQPPASVAKALTAAYGLDVLGADYRFETKVLATGAISNGVVQGDVILAGGGDPTLDTDGLAKLAAQLKQAGVTGVKGAFKIYGGALPYIRGIDAGQPDHVGYNPAVSGLNLNYNRVHFEWRRANGSYDVTMQARTEAHRPDVRFAKMQVIARDVPVYTYEDKGGLDNWTVAKGALGKGGARWLPVRKPGIYAGEVFQSLARAQGIKLDAPEYLESLPTASEITKVQSKPLASILKDMLKWSTNLTAEIVGMTASQKRSGKPVKSLKQSAQVMNAWAKQSFDLPSVALVDHSGLGEQSRITARDMMSALRQLRGTSELKPLLKPFKMLDAQRKVIKDHPLSVHAKTGTLNFVSGLAGYVDLPDGTELVFAIFAANLDKRANLKKSERERPPGGREWNRRAKRLQQELIERWGIVYSS
ncbi:D-alanyl-D-alanine carboxypeptidase DacB precursor [Pelagimonas phthalicica]|uniref:D-alanyl-D-alanine carboxypeptidase DacB n=1 Tax=Pelagimonas phthalicica TaxID=1037362 RepID=A0A238JHV6_9RHOB|nr:D-alanyl-D-alanine carboxypeptidase/D-alanyl-D-alanine-endopeptidase [Pelagimonas phthalicica]TDS89805.1 D-alanyl-D-alanine carboxypeptidase/D-alanyl-D-alanine-endopeptidase (penicillin-binding protein 4) [Pelagimonas phthalicica]SMX29973.1 D-alanyl-D-alanine carboxypeptidase DacB precursor [Pelagimonas phthalicica]